MAGFLHGWSGEAARGLRRRPRGAPEQGRRGEVPYFELAPDFVCEVLSPSTYAKDRGPKLRAYAREGVAHAWLVEPTARVLEVLRLDGASYRIVGAFEGDARVRAEPFDAIELELGALWAR